MLNRNLFRERPELIRENLRRRRQDGRVGDVDRMIDLDERVRSAGTRLDELRRLAKAASQEIGRALKAGEDAAERKANVRRLGDEIAELEESLRAQEAERDALELTFPSLLDDDVPDGDGADDNPVLRTWGAPPALDFEPLPHDQLGERLGILDFARAAKVSGARFTFLAGAGARLEHALIAFMRRVHEEAGDVELLPPLIVSAETLTGSGNLPKFEDALFRVGHEPLRYLIPTAEVPLTNYHADEILDAAHLPRRYFAATPCFRSEAGSYGKDVRGYIRQHHFNKVEMVRLTTPEQARAELEAMTDRAEEILRRLELHHRVVVLCSGDTGFWSTRTHDIEVWLPSQGAFREISSCSTCGDYQARRAKIRFRREPGDKPAFVHTLNGSGLAVGRTLVAILEQCQQRDGSVKIPAALRPHFGASEIRPS